MTMTRDKIAELKRLAKAATPGEWAHDNNTVATRQACITVEAFGASYDETVDNAAFIAAANPQTILSLLALAERALNTSPVALSEYDARKPMSPALQALIESGQAEDGDADLVEPQGPTRVAAQLNMSITPDAYIGAREDMGIWKKRALEAEESNRALMASINGPIFMGDPLLPSVGNLPQHSLEPQGQALPELPPPAYKQQYVCTKCGATGEGTGAAHTRLDGSRCSYMASHHGPWFTADQMRAYASQLALPAGPSDEQIKKAIQELDECEAFNDDGVTKEAIAIIRKLFAPSPAVAQPVADERLDARRWRAAIKHGGVHIGNGITLDGEDAVVAVDVLLKAMAERGEA